ncbi:MAG: MarR family transcriptional regulator [Sphingobium sp.]|nr:MarR family transcriptional regulator [Sphingobium sp.]
MDDSPAAVRAWFNRRAVVQMTMAANRAVNEAFGREVFSAPAWEMLLDLYSRNPNEVISVTSLCIAANVPTRTAQHVIERLVELGLLVRSSHPSDKRLALISLSALSITLLDKVFDHLMDLTLINGIAPERNLGDPI